MTKDQSCKKDWDHYTKCIKCGVERDRYTIGTVDDRCPQCQFKEGCCD